LVLRPNLESGAGGPIHLDGSFCTRTTWLFLGVAIAVCFWLTGCACMPSPRRLGERAFRGSRPGTGRGGQPGFVTGLGLPLESSAGAEPIAVLRIDVVLIVALLIFTDPTNFGGPAVY
jgi:hypothetical protein